MRQLWRHLGFLHWPVDADAVRALLPPGLDVDTFDGVAYVGVVPFTVPRGRMPGVGVPITPPFHELNVRTYVHRDGRDPGIWFFSLDAASRLAVAGARCAYRLPYFHAAMKMTVTSAGGATVIDYASRRRRGNATFRARYRPQGRVAPATLGSLEFFLLERYLLFAWNGRALRTARVAHVPYPAQPAVATDVVETVVAAAGLSAPAGPPPLVHYARELDVRIYRPHAL
jgi:uncharacterized protein YqjF (DUF2071 family)